MLITAFDHIQSDLDDLKSMLVRALPNSKFCGFTDFSAFIDFAIEKNPSVIILENIEGNGWYLLADTVEKLTKINPDIRFIILHWSKISKEELLWAINSKVTSFLQKPIKYEELLEALNDIVANN